MMSKKRVQARWVYTLIICVVMLATAVILTAASENSKSEEFPTNRKGQTYGSGLVENPNDSVLPDLIFASGVDGTDGYVLRTDLEGCGPLAKPNNPEEAMVYMDELDKLIKEAILRGDQYLYYIPLYASDGETIIGKFGISIPIDTEDFIIK